MTTVTWTALETAGGASTLRCAAEMSTRGPSTGPSPSENTERSVSLPPLAAAPICAFIDVLLMDMNEGTCVSVSELSASRLSASRAVSMDTSAPMASPTGVKETGPSGSISSQYSVMGIWTPTTSSTS